MPSLFNVIAQITACWQLRFISKNTPTTRPLSIKKRPRRFIVFQFLLQFISNLFVRAYMSITNKCIIFIFVSNTLNSSKPFITKINLECLKYYQNQFAQKLL